MKTNKILISIVNALFIVNFSLLTFYCFAQGVAINITGDSAVNSAILDVKSTAQGVLISRMTTIQRDSIAIKCACVPTTGLQIYNTTTNCLEIFVGTTWQSIGCGCTSAPAAAGTISGTSTVCPGQNAVLFSVPAIARSTNYIWSYSGTGAFIVGSTNAVIVYFSGTATSGNLTVQGINACGNGTVSADYPIAVNSTAPNITAQPASVNTCLGSGAVTFTVTASGGLSYQWQEYTSSWNNVANAGVYSNVTTATLTITNPPIGMNGYKYRCIVSGTCTSSTSDGAATLTVNSVPSVTNASTAIICSGTSPNISLTSSVPSNFAWTIGTITGNITGASGSSSSTINQTLTNPSNATAGSVQYLVTPTSTTGSCVGASFTITITVNPTPTVTNSPLTQSICSAGSTTLVTLTSNVSGTTFAWTTSASAGISGFTSSGTSNIPVQMMSNSGSTAGTVTYAITPTANSCTGAISNYVTTVNPLPAATTATTVTGGASHQITANWITVTGATSYLLDVSTATNFGSFVGSYNGLNVGNVLTNNVTGLTAGTTYYYRVRAVNSCGSGENSNTITTTTLNIADNIVAYWKLDETNGNASDAFGSNTLINNNTTTFVAGKINNSANLVQSSFQYFSITDAAQAGLDFGTGDFTINLWYKCASISANGDGFFEKGEGGGNAQYWVRFQDNTGNVIRFITTDGPNETSVQTSSAGITAGNWYMLTFIRNGTTVSITINAGTAVTTTGTIRNCDNASGFFLGRTPGGAYINGIIDEVGIWSRAISSIEISTLYNSGNGLQYPF